MSGGVAYVLDEAGDFKTRCNLTMVDLEPLIADEDVEEVKELLRRHVRYTQSTVAERILKQWDEMQPKFVKVMPKDYKRVINAIKRAQAEGIPWEQAAMVGAHG